MNMCNNHFVVGNLWSLFFFFKLFFFFWHIMLHVHGSG